MKLRVGPDFDPDCYEALVRVMTGKTVRPPKAAPLLDTLTPQETEGLSLLAQGLSNPAIAQVLVGSRKTVEHHLEHIYDKLGISCRTAAVASAVQHGLGRRSPW